MSKLKSEETQVKLLFAAAVCVLIAVLVPLFWIAHYNFKSVDDFTFSQNAEAVWEESHSVINVLVEQLSYVKKTYYTWQGTFFSNWFSTSMMGIFSKNHYYVGTYLSLGSFVLAEAVLFMLIFLKVLRTDIYRAGIVTACCLSFQVLFTAVPSEAYFWFCGAVVYTFIHALGLLLVAALIAFHYAEKVWKTVLLEILIVFLTIAVGGSNYITGLTMLTVYGLAVIWVFYKKHVRRWTYLGNAVLFTIAFLANMLAPGNRIRQTASGVAHMSAVEAILRSLKEAAVYVISYAAFPCLLLGVMFLPLFVHMVKKTKYRYPLPLLISTVSFGVFAAQFTPTLYALGILGAGRVMNLYRLNYYIFLFGNELYWTGWFVRRREERYETVEKPDAKPRASLLLPAWCLGGAILCLSLVYWGGDKLTSVSAVLSLRTGQAQQYYQEYQERLKILEDPAVQEAYLEPYTYRPYLLFFGDIQPDSQDWVNQSMADYFGKEAIYLLE